jgi:hypothetical protein
MAGDWIKVEHGLIDKPEVMEMADILEITPHQVVGHLVQFWFWCDRNLSPECPQVKGTRRGLDRVAGWDGFGDAMVSVGWLTIDGGLISVPNYDTHLSKSAKQRAKDQRKKAFQRSKLSPTCPDSVPTSRGRNGGPEKRREEKIYTHTHTEENSVQKLDLPDWVVDPWSRFLDTVFAVTGRRMPATTQDATLMEVLRRGEAKGKADLEFSILKQAKSLLDSSNDFQARSVGSTARSASKSKSEAIKEFCK